MRAACLFAAGCIAAPAARAAFLPVVGGPAYVPGTVGYKAGGVPLPPSAPINNSGAAIGYADRYDAAGANKGQRATRWDAAGNAIELGGLGTALSGAALSRANAINAAGVAVGRAERFNASGTSLGYRAVRWDAAGVATELAALSTDTSGRTYTTALAVNTAGVVGGQAQKYGAANADLGRRPVRWDAAGVVTELGIIGTTANGSTNGMVNALNDSNVAAGSAVKYVAGASMGQRPVRWDPFGTVTELGILGTDTAGSTTGAAYALSASGSVAGIVQKYDAGCTLLGGRPVRWDFAGNVIALGTLGTTTAGFTDGVVWSLNGSDVAAGFVRKYTAGGTLLGNRASRWDPAGNITELGNLGTDGTGAANTSASALNSAGVVVGVAQFYDGAGTNMGVRAVYWGADGAAVDLNTLIDPVSGWVLTEADGISDTGWISGAGTFDPDGPGGQAAYTRTFSIQVAAAAVPEPGGAMGVGIAVLAGSLTRRRRGAARRHGRRETR